MRYLLTALAFLGAAYAQSRDTAAVFGTVTDAQGSAIPGAVVKLTNLSTGQARNATTGASGEYLFPSVLVGTYSLTAEQPAFKRSERTGILLQANENVKVDVSLEVGDVKTTVSVDAAASQVEVRSSTIKETVDRARVVELPLNGRNAADLALLATGVTAFGSNTGDISSSWRPRGTKEFSVNGSRNNNVRFTLDGGANMDSLMNTNLPFPFPDAVQEFSVETSNMSLDQGSTSAGAVNVVTKSGTNQIHGDAFWFVRNTELNASNFFSRQQDQLKRNQTGFTLGGPLRKSKLFAFGGYQQLWIRTASGATRVQTLTAQERSGDFSSNPIVIYDPQSGQPFPRNTIPQNRLSQGALKLLAVSPIPDPDGYTRFSFATPENGKQYVGRMDYVLNDKHTVLFRVFENHQNNPYHSPPDNIHAGRVQGYQDTRNATLSHNFVIRPGLMTHTQVSGMHQVSQSISDFDKSVRDFGINVYAASNDVAFSMTNSGASINSDPKVGFNRAAEEVVHDWNWTKSGHTFSWGAQFAWSQYNEDTVFHSSGAWQFDGHVTANSPVSPGFDRADFMLGRFSSFTQNNGELENRRQFTKGFFFGDVWRLSRRLTLNFGLRWEPFDFLSDTLGRNQTFDLGNYQKGVRSKIFLNAPAGLLYAGDDNPSGGTMPGSVVQRDYNNLAPRLGIAWDPFGNGKTAIRGGYGMYYDAPQLWLLNNANNVSPFSYSTLFFDGQLENPYLGRESSNKYPLTSFGKDSPFDSPLETIVADGKWVASYTQQWNLTLERELVKDTRLRLAYVGTQSAHLKGEYDQNAPIYNPNLSLAQNRASIDARRPLAGYSRIVRFFHGLNASYNSLQVSLDKRYSHGFTILTSYTWSKALDYQSRNQAAQDAPPSYPFNFFLGHGPTTGDRRHRFVSSSVWDLPGANHGALAKAITRDWKLSGILTLQSGRFFTIAATGDPLAGISGARVDLIGSGNPVLPSGRSKGEMVNKYFDTTRFSNAAPNTLGTLGRNVLEGPGFANVDVSMVKGFRIRKLGEGGLGQFRFEAFNLFNRTNFGLPNTGITNSNFGRLTGTDGDPRILQIAIKVIF